MVLLVLLTVGFATDHLTLHSLNSLKQLYLAQSVGDVYNAKLCIFTVEKNAFPGLNVSEQPFSVSEHKILFLILLGIFIPYNASLSYQKKI